MGHVTIESVDRRTVVMQIGGGSISLLQNGVEVGRVFVTLTSVPSTKIEEWYLYSNYTWPGSANPLVTTTFKYVANLTRPTTFATYINCPCITTCAP